MAAELNRNRAGHTAVWGQEVGGGVCSLLPPTSWGPPHPRTSQEVDLGCRLPKRHSPSHTAASLLPILQPQPGGRRDKGHSISPSGSSPKGEGGGVEPGLACLVGWRAEDRDGSASSPVT